MYVNKYFVFFDVPKPLTLNSLTINFGLLLVLLTSISFISKGEENPYAELKGLSGDYACIKAFEILTLDQNVHSSSKARNNIEYILRLANETGDSSLRCVYFETLANYTSMHYDRINTKSTQYHLAAIATASRNDLDVQLLRQNYSFGKYYTTYAKIGDAYPYYKRSIELINEVGDSNVPEIWSYYQTLGRYFYMIEDYTTAEILLKKVLKYHQRVRSRDFLDVINTLGLIALNSGREEDATSNFEKVYSLANKQLDSAWMGIAYGNMGNVAVKEGNSKKAIYYFSLDYEYNSKPSGDIISALGSLKKKAIEEEKVGDFQSSLDNINIYLAKMERKPARYKDLAEAYDLKGRLLEKLNIHEDQLAVLKEYSKYERLHTELANKDSIQTIKLLEEKDRFNSITNLSKKYIIWIYLLGGALLISLIGLAYYFFIKKNKKTEPRPIEMLEMDGNKVFIVRKSNYDPLEILSDKRFAAEDQHKPKHISMELSNLLNENLLNVRNWKKFKAAFSEDFPGFFDEVALQYPGITEGELRLLALINLNIPNKDLANKLSLSVDGIKKAKQRLKRKLIFQSNLN